MDVKQVLSMKVLLYIMGKGLEGISQVNEELQEDLEEIEDGSTIQWKIGEEIRMYLEISEGRITAHLDEEHPEPTVSLIVEDMSKAREILSGAADGTSAYMAGDLKIEGDMPLSMKMGQLAEYLTEALSEIMSPE